MAFIDALKSVYGDQQITDEAKDYLKGFESASKEEKINALKSVYEQQQITDEGKDFLKAAIESQVAKDAQPTLSERFANKPLAVANPSLSDLANAPQKAPGEQSLEMLFPNLMAKSGQYGTDKGVLGNLGVFGKNVGLAGLDLATILGRAGKQALGLGRMQDVGADQQSTFEQGFLPGVRGMIQGAAGDPTQLIGGPVYGMAKAGIGAAVANPLLSKLAVGATTGGLLGQASNTIQATAGNAEFDPSAGLYGAAGGMLGEGLGSLVGAGARKIGLMERGSPTVTANQGEFSTPKQQVRDVEKAAYELNITPNDLNQIDPKYRGVVASIKPEEKPLLAEFNELSHKHLLGSNERPMNVAAERYFSEFENAIKANREKYGSQMGEIEKQTINGGMLDAQPLLDKIQGAIEKYGLQVIKDEKTGNFHIVEPKGAIAKFDPEGFPELDKMANLYFKKLGNTTTGEDLRKIEMRADKAIRDEEGRRKSVSPDVRRLFKDIGSLTDKHVESEIAAKNPELLEPYIKAKKQVAQSHAAEELLGKKVGTPISWVDDETGKVIEGSTTGPSFFQALTNSGAQQRGVPELAEIAKTLTGKDLRRVAVLARYSEEAAGIRGPRKQGMDIPSVSVQWAVNLAKNITKSKAEKVLPEQFLIASKVAGSKGQSPTKKAIQSVAKDVAPKAQAGAVYGGAVGASLAPGLSDAQAKKKLSDLRVKK